MLRIRVWYKIKYQYNINILMIEIYVIYIFSCYLLITKIICITTHNFNQMIWTKNLKRHLRWWGITSKWEKFLAINIRKTRFKPKTFQKTISTGRWIHLKKNLDLVDNGLNIHQMFIFYYFSNIFKDLAFLFSLLFSRSPNHFQNKIPDIPT